jgi:hypothetical protein
MRLTVSQPSEQGWLCDVDFGHEFWTPTERLLAGAAVVAETTVSDS